MNTCTGALWWVGPRGTGQGAVLDGAVDVQRQTGRAGTRPRQLRDLAQFGYVKDTRTGTRSGVHVVWRCTCVYVERIRVQGLVPRKRGRVCVCIHSACMLAWSGIV